MLIKDEELSLNKSAADDTVQPLMLHVNKQTASKER